MVARKLKIVAFLNYKYGFWSTVEKWKARYCSFDYCYILLLAPFGCKFLFLYLKYVIVIPFYYYFLKDIYLIITHRWQEVERLRGERNAVANKMKGKLEPSMRQSLVEEGSNQ